MSVHAPVAVILLAGGGVACFLGYRLLRLLLAAGGFAAGAAAAAALARGLDVWLVVAAAVAGGAAGAVLATAAYLAGVAVLGAALGAAAVNALWASDAGDPGLWVFLGVGLAGAFAALALRRWVILIGTSFGGAWVALVGGLALAGDAAATAAARGDVQRLYPLAPVSTQIEFAVAWLVLGAVALAVQLRTSRRRPA